MIVRSFVVEEQSRFQQGRRGSAFAPGEVLAPRPAPPLSCLEDVAAPSSSCLTQHAFAAATLGPARS